MLLKECIHETQDFGIVSDPFPQPESFLAQGDPPTVVIQLWKQGGGGGRESCWSKLPNSEHQLGFCLNSPQLSKLQSHPLHGERTFSILLVWQEAGLGLLSLGHPGRQEDKVRKACPCCPRDRRDEESSEDSWVLRILVFESPFLQLTEGEGGGAACL